MPDTSFAPLATSTDMGDYKNCRITGWGRTCGTCGMELCHIYFTS